MGRSSLTNLLPVQYWKQWCYSGRGGSKSEGRTKFKLY